MKAPFNPREVFVQAGRILALPPAKPHIVRVEGRGAIVEQFALPLDLCRPQNRTRHAPGFALAKLKRQCLFVMRAQLAMHRTCPLPGRPQVVVVRFSSVEPDAFADGAKVAVDCLVKLGVIVDDKPSCIDLSQSWEKAPPGSGFVVLSVYTGAA